MLDDVEHRDDIYLADPRHGGFIGDARMDLQAGLPAGLRRVFGELDPRHVVVAARFLEKEPVGAAQIEQSPRRTETSDKIDATRELASQYRLTALIIQISVAALT